MNIARLLYPVTVLGPGRRVGLWLCGCSRKCYGCSNPELWYQKEEYETSPENVFRLINKIIAVNEIDGFTVTGGEPLDQADDLAQLIKMLLSISDDILIYSGYLIEELKNRQDDPTKYILSSAAVLIDGAYVENLNDNSVLRGSSNQRIHILNRKYEKMYHDYLSIAHNQIQNFTTGSGIVSVGIHHPTF